MMSYVSHQLIVISSLNVTLPYYLEYTGLRLLHRHNRPEQQQQVVWLGSRPHGSRLILVEGAKVETAIGPYGHVGISCKTREEYLELLRKVQEKGILERGPLSQPWPIAEWFSILDPDGNRLEISYGQDAWPELESEDLSHLDNNES